MRHIYLILIIVFSSCADNDKLKSLEKENTDLKKEIKQLKEQMPSYEFEAYAIPNKKELTVGDTLFASVGLVAFDRNNPVTAVIGKMDFENQTIIPKDTLHFDSESQQSWFTAHATDTGNFVHYGTVFHKTHGELQKHNFVIDYQVSSK